MRVSPLVFQSLGRYWVGTFAVTIAHLLSHNSNVLLFARRQEVVDSINSNHQMYGLSVTQ
jgi:glycerol-3-phosphate dehydrogenase